MEANRERPAGEKPAEIGASGASRGGVGQAPDAIRAEGSANVVKLEMRGGTVANTVACGPAVILAFAGPRSQARRWKW